MIRIFYSHHLNSSSSLEKINRSPIPRKFFFSTSLLWTLMKTVSLGFFLCESKPEFLYVSFNWIKKIIFFFRIYRLFCWNLMVSLRESHAWFVLSYPNQFPLLRIKKPVRSFLLSRRPNEINWKFLRSKHAKLLIYGTNEKKLTYYFKVLSEMNQTHNSLKNLFQKNIDPKETGNFWTQKPLFKLN